MQWLSNIIFFVILCINLSQAKNTTNSTNAGVPTNSSSNATTPLTTLYIGAFFDLGEKNGYGSLPMAEQAIEEINNNTDILPGYRLELVVNSTQGSFGFGQKVLHEFLNTGPKKIMLLGPGQDALAKSVAAYAGIPEVSLLQFSYGTSDLELANNRNLYPNFFRTKTSLASLDAPRISFIKEYGWDEVGIIYGDSVQYLQLSNQLASNLKQNNIQVLAEVRLQGNDPTRAIRTIQDKQIHVILGMFSLDAVARKMICEAYRQKMYGPHYVWMLIDSQDNNWWIPGKNEESACSDVEMQCQIQNHFSFFNTKVFSLKSRYYDYAKKNGTQIIDDYRSRVDNGNDTSNRSDIYLNVYDAVWSIAFVLHNSRDELHKQGKTLENLTYGDANATAVFRTQAEILNFITPNKGLRVRYYTDGNRKNAVVLKQLVITDGKFKMINAGNYDVDTKGFTASTEIHWFAGTPYTKTTETYTYRTIDRNLFIALVVLASLGIVYALFCFLTLVLNFKKKIVQNSGPVISMLIIIGCILNYVTVILYGFDYSLVATDTVTQLCRARSWTFAIGFTLSVGGLAAKLWMAYSVLKDRFVRSRNVMMFWMLGILVFLVIIDIIILAFWTSRDPLYRALKQVRSQPEYKCFEPIAADTFRADIEVVEYCDCADLTLWLVIILVFKGLILLTGGFLAWQTRRVYIPALNDTQHCVSCMFVVVLFCLVGSIVAFTTTLYPSIYYGFIGALIIVATTLILVLLFTSKIVRLTCRRKRTKTLRISEGSADSNKYACACGAACAKFFSFCACSATCCISCCSCFPFCNLYSCLRSICFGSQVHPTKGDGEESKAEFYVGGIAQDRDAEIVYLRNEIREKNTQLSNLGQKRTVKSNWTQTMDNGSSLWNGDDSDSMFSDGNASDVESTQGSEARQRFQRAANKFKIFNQATDYSHVKSKVNTGMRRNTLAPGSPQVRRGSRMSVHSDEDLIKLKSTLAEKDDEITKLRKELERLTTKHLAVRTKQSTPLQQKPSSNTEKIILIETPATPIPPEVQSTTIFQFPVTSSPSTPAVSPSRDGDKTSGKAATEVKTQDRSNKKSSLGPAGSWLFKDQPESTKDNKKNSEKIAQGKNSKDNDKTRERDSENPKTNTHNSKTSPNGEKEDEKNRGTSPGSRSSSEPHDKVKTNGENHMTSSTKIRPQVNEKASLTYVTLSEFPAKSTESEKASKATDDANDGKQKLNNGDGETGSKEQDETRTGHLQEQTGNTNEATKGKKKPLNEKISSWLFGDKKDEDANKNVTEKDKDENRRQDKNSKENEKIKTDHSVTPNEEVKQNSLTDGKNNKMNQLGGGDGSSLPVGSNSDAVGAEKNANNSDVKDKEAKKGNITQDDTGHVSERCENDDERNMEIIDEEDGDDDDDFGHDDDDDDDDNDNDNDKGEAQSGGKRVGVGAAGRRGSKKGGRRRRKTFGKLQWNAQSKVDTGSSRYKPRESIIKIPHFKNDYSHVKSRVSKVGEANTVNEDTVNSEATKRQRSLSLNKNPKPDYSNVRPRLYNGATKKYNSEMPSAIPN